MNPSETVIFSEWVAGACACKTGGKMRDNPNMVDPIQKTRASAAMWRAWGRGYRAWERDAKHRETKEEGHQS